MQREHLISAVGAVLFVAFPLIAQQKPGNIAVLEFQKPKNGMLQEYENGRKQKAAWHKQQNDPNSLFVWEILSGDSTGTYVVGEFGQHWADFDKPAVPEQADESEYQKAIAGYVESRITRYYEFLPKVSNAEDNMSPPKYSEIVTFNLRYGKNSDFRSAIDQVCQAAQKTKWAQHFEWYVLANGGPTGEYVLAIPHKDWADFEDDPNIKPFRDMLKEAFGQAQTDSIVNLIDASVEKETSEIVQFRPDLSYLPAK